MLEAHSDTLPIHPHTCPARVGTAVGSFLLEYYLIYVVRAVPAVLDLAIAVGLTAGATTAVR